MFFEHSGNFFNVLFSLAITYFKRLNAVLPLFKQTSQPLRLFFVKRKTLQRSDQVGNHAACFTQILGAHVIKRRLGKTRNLFLQCGTILQNEVRIG
ncbi:hypothetical protein SDC9_184519 [bioreactor metagenome]|uniref:Uncharacterized protein n=1 Tax=bioreactor metagenome TaxID=1076179 RepID=A0A645HDA1_9ZZZZ